MRRWQCTAPEVGIVLRREGRRRGLYGVGRAAWVTSHKRTAGGGVGGVAGVAGSGMGAHFMRAVTSRVAVPMRCEPATPFVHASTKREVWDRGTHRRRRGIKRG